MKQLIRIFIATLVLAFMFTVPAMAQDSITFTLVPASPDVDITAFELLTPPDLLQLDSYQVDEGQTQNRFVSQIFRSMVMDVSVQQGNSIHSVSLHTQAIEGNCFFVGTLTVSRIISRTFNFNTGGFDYRVEFSGWLHYAGCISRSVFLNNDLIN